MRETSVYFSRRSLWLTPAMAFGFALPAAAVPHDFQIGDVVAGVANGTYNIYDNSGNFIESISDGLFGFTTGAFFLRDDTNPPGRLFTTDFSASTVVVYDGSSGHAILRTVNTGANGGAAVESVLFNQAGDFLVGHADGDRTVKRYSDPGNALLQTYVVQTGSRGSDWIDLATDQTTLCYTSEGNIVYRFDLNTSTQLPNFSANLVGGPSYALRILPPFDLSGGMIVANQGDIRRLDSGGNVVQTYDVAGDDGWFAMNLDPNGTSFWGGSFFTGNFYRFDIATGAIEVGPIFSGTTSLFGLAVVGELSGGINNPPMFDAPSPCGMSFDLGAGIPFSYTVAASDPDAGDSITLDAVGEPAGSTHTPPLPLAGGPDQDLMTVFNWTPTSAQAGQSYVITYTVTDQDGASSTCTVTLNVAECFLTLGTGAGDDVFFRNGHAFQTQLENIYESYPILLDDIPVFEIDLGGPWQAVGVGNSNKFVVEHFFAQAMMWNPEMFPDNPEQSTRGLEVKIWSDGTVTSKRFGQRDGMDLAVETFTGTDGKRYYRFPFTIDGM
jgi:hypothetical protein